jgi:Protein of unknown function (DUF2892)
MMVQLNQLIMKANMGTLDKALRISIALVIVILYFMSQISGTAALILLTFAGIFILTSFMSFCPLYFPFGISTRGKVKA